MKTTRILRRIDDLGRIVIPREIRRSMGICEGEAFEIYTGVVDGMPCIGFAKCQHKFNKELSCITERIYEQMINCSEPDLAAEFQENMKKVSAIIKKFEKSIDK